jgi:hypothetical protein
VVTAGSFLIDAETRLNPAAGSIYFGGSGGSKGASASAVRPSTDELSAEDRRLVEAQQFCPVREKSRLGSMGTPVKLTLAGTPVFLCCSGCLDQARANQGRTLARVAELRARPRAAGPMIDPELEMKVKANLDRLPREERPLAETQRFCPVSEDRLGSPAMGVPVKVLTKAGTVFVCCESCRDGVLARPEQMLRKVEQLKAKEKDAKPNR